MSLLNDALRKAEGRRDAPATSGVYTGATRATSAAPRQSRWIWWLLGFVLLVAAVLAWLLFQWEAPKTMAEKSNPIMRASGPVSSGKVAEPAITATQKKPAVLPETTTHRKGASPAPTVDKTAPPERSASKSPLELQLKPQSEQQLNQHQTMAASLPTNKSGADTLPPAPHKAQEKTPAKVAMVPQASEETRASAKTTTETTATGATARAAKPSTTDVVKNTHMTPAVRDQQTADAIRQALDKGRYSEARAQLDRIIATQDAPRSRTRWARYQLVHGQPRQALTVLPFDLAASDTMLRLLRARAQLALGDSATALKTLQAHVPEVSESPEYAITLATLLQQAGEYRAASERWARLIAYDDQRGAWWVGLAITLENQQRSDAAIRAYEQALALPDLKPSLDQFVRQRLQAFGSTRDHG